MPGAPGYLEYVCHSPKYETSVIKAHVEYTTAIEDALAISKYIATE